jgi:RimJ/RimL family protein N-acetyltransferase
MREAVTDGAIQVRAYRSEDRRALHAAVWESIPEVSKYETWCHPGYRLEEGAEYVDYWVEARAKGQAFYYAVVDSTTGEFLGSCGLAGLSVEHKHAGLGYWVRTSRTGRGIATAAARLVARLGFEDLGLIRVELEIAVDNTASRRVAEKLGAISEGILRRRLILPAGPTDVVMYALLPHELRTA